MLFSDFTIFRNQTLMKLAMCYVTHEKYISKSDKLQDKGVFDQDDKYIVII